MMAAPSLFHHDLKTERLSTREDQRVSELREDQSLGVRATRKPEGVRLRQLADVTAETFSSLQEKIQENIRLQRENTRQASTVARLQEENTRYKGERLSRLQEESNR